MNGRAGTVRVLWVALAVIVAACGQPTPSASGPPVSGSASPSPSGTQPSSPATGGELVVGLSAETESMDPHLVYQNAGQSIMHALFDTLLTVAPDGTLGPGLATEWTVVDDTTIELTLRDGVTFHNGEAFDAEAVRGSVYRVLDIDPATDAPIADDAAKLNSQLASDYGAIQTVEAVDATHVRLNLSRADAALPSALGRFFVVPPEYIAEVGNAGFGQQPVGTGPFTFVEWVKDDHSLVRANPNYWDSPRGTPMVETVRFRPLVDPRTRTDEITTGGVDILMDPSLDQRDAIEGAGGQLRFQENDPHHVEIWLTTDKGGTLAADPDAPAATKEAIEALAKPEVRVALNMAVDRQTIIDTLLDGLGEPMTHLFVNGDLGFDPAIPPYPYDPDAARQMLADAGYPDGLDVQLDFCTCDRLDPIEAVIANLEAIGVRVTINQFEISQFNNDWVQGKTNPMRSARLGFNDPNIYLQFWAKSGGLLSRYANPEVDALIDQQAVEYDLAARTAIVKQISPITHDNPPAIFLWSSPNLYATGAGVGGWEPHFLGYVPVVNTTVSG